VRRFTSAAVALAAALALAPTAVAAVRGDSFTQPIAIRSVPFTSRLNTMQATREPSDPAPTCTFGALEDPSIWYRFTPTSSSTYLAETLRSDFTRSGPTTDTVIVVLTYDGNTQTFTEVGCDDDGGDAHGGALHTSWLEVSLSAGTTYYFMVGGLQTADYGRLVFSLTLSSI